MVSSKIVVVNVTSVNSFGLEYTFIFDLTEPFNSSCDNISPSGSNIFALTVIVLSTMSEVAFILNRTHDPASSREDILIDLWPLYACSSEIVISLVWSTFVPLIYSVFSVMVLSISPPVQMLLLNKFSLSFTVVVIVGCL